MVYTPSVYVKREYEYDSCSWKDTHSDCCRGVLPIDLATSVPRARPRLLLVYVEPPDFEAALAGLAALEVNRCCHREMAGFFEEGDRKNADQQIKPFAEVFHLA